MEGKKLIRIQTGQFKGVDYIDIRECYRDENDEIRYTKKGIAIPPEQLKDFLKTLGEVVK